MSKSWMKNFSEKRTWSDWFSDIILERGRDYFNDGAVEELIFNSEENKILAKVSGSSEYTVSIQISEDGQDIEDMRCSCPYAEDGSHCKHMAAVLYAAEGQMKKGSIKTVEGETLSDEIRRVVNSLSVEDLRRFLTEAAEAYPALRDRLMHYSGNPVSQNQLEQWIFELQAMEADAEDEYGFVYNAEELTYSMGAFLDQKVQYLSDHGQKEEAFRLVCAAYDTIASADGDDSEGDFEYFFEECVERWEKLLIHSTPELRRTVYHWFESNDGQRGYETAFGFMCGAFDDKELLEKQLVFLDRLIGTCGMGSDYHLEKLVCRRIAVMQALSLPQKEIAAYRKEYHALSGVRREEIEEYMRKRQYGKAEALLRESLVLDKQYGGLTDEYHVKLLALLKETGQETKYDTELRDYVLNHSQRDLTYILALKERMTAKEWETVRETLLTDSVHSGIRFDLMEHEGLFRRLFDAIKERDTDNCLLNYEKTLKKHFPDEMRDELLRRANDNMMKASTRKAYAYVAGSLSRILSYPDGEQKVRALVESWKSQRRRPAMIEELERAGY